MTGINFMFMWDEHEKLYKLGQDFFYNSNILFNTQYRNKNKKIKEIIKGEHNAHTPIIEHSFFSWEPIWSLCFLLIFKH